MPTSTLVELSQFALDVCAGLSVQGQKKISPRYLYDDLGSALFEAITHVPEYGLSRADERLLKRHSGEIGDSCGRVSVLAELGSGSGKKTEHVLRSLVVKNRDLTYCPIDVSASALAICERELGSLCRIKPVLNDWIEGLDNVNQGRIGGERLLLLFLGSSIGNLERSELATFLTQLRQLLLPGDFFLLGADLVKDEKQMLSAYDDATGVTAAFNLNLLGRINRELEADFCLDSFGHQARWNADERRIEMHLVSRCTQVVRIAALEIAGFDTSFSFEAGESIWTESSHKFSQSELQLFASQSGFRILSTWVDEVWPFAETLWQVE